MCEPDADAIVGALGDTDRRRLLAAIELGAATLPDAAKASGLPDQRAAKALARLLASHLVVGDTDGGLRVDDDGSGPKLFAGGDFLAIDGVAAPAVARWNGATWSAAANGVRGSVRALAPFVDAGGHQHRRGIDTIHRAGAGHARPAPRADRWCAARA